MDDVYKTFSTESEARGYSNRLESIAKAGDKITVKYYQNNDDWKPQRIYYKVIEQDAPYWRTRKPLEPIPDV